MSEERSMADEGTPGRAIEPDPTGEPSADERVPFWQQVLDNPFLLLFLGVTIPTVLYVIWGIIEVANIPIAK
jgi:hypothetical protein